MDEAVIYTSEGDSSDKHYTTSLSYVSSIHSSQVYGQYRQCYSNKNAVAATGIGSGHKIITACKGNALLHLYLWGKESPEQKIPVPEEITALEIIENPVKLGFNEEEVGNNFLLIGGGKSGRIYVWNLNSGLLLNVQEAHYQSVSCIKYSDNFLISSGFDSRIVVWKILDLINLQSFRDNDSNGGGINNVKPYTIFSDHKLPVTDLFVSKGLVTDIKLYSTSQDSTVRCYNLYSKQLLTTFVCPYPVSSITCDPAYRSLYVGFNNGKIRQIPLFAPVSKLSNVFEAVGGCGKIITIDTDPELKYTFTHFNDGDANGNDVTKLEISIDGTSLITGDSKGRLLVVDIITKQIKKKLKHLVGPIAFLKIVPVSNEVIGNNGTGNNNNNSNNDKSIIRAIPVLKRTQIEAIDLMKIEINKKITMNDDLKSLLLTNYDDDNLENYNGFDLQSFLDETASQEKNFINFSNVNSTVIKSKSDNNNTNNDISEEQAKIKRLEEKLSTVTKGYSELKKIHEQLYKEHSQLLNEKKN
ncbi:hypothetical protein B5S32_g3812 [[Candida] boidinii]|nr:hypothetical protein B5S32_g3812 [[Candida] boidinii]